ncbi:unnamed protein product [Rhizoctonia solani]|uniref:NADP-dependent oxidoreductase domain-containing protein n=1 Tax=Rhizoctonia solani TaxID=456999 RepID=A0A8H2WA64_9AGAM|nr:unnamed protein product [Rhizoctonia solani]
MNDLIEFVKIRSVGLSQPSRATLNRTHKVHPIATIQVESFQCALEQKGHHLETTRELGGAIVAYSPLIRGLLAGEITSHSDLSDTDMKKITPRYAQESFPKIPELVENFK